MACSITGILNRMAVTSKREQQQKIVIIVIVLLCVLAVVGVMVLRHMQAQRATETKLPTNAPLSIKLGDQNAKLKVVIYTDPVCDKCADYHNETIKPLYEDYVKKDKVELDIRPVSIVTEQSAPLTELLMCSNEQHKYMATADFMYRELTRQNGKVMTVNAATFFQDYPMIQIARATDMEESKLTSCVRDDRYTDRIKQADTQAYAANIYSTPTTFVGTQDPVRGYAIYDYVKSLIDISL